MANSYAVLLLRIIYQLEWTIYKKNPGSGTQINYGDEIYFVNDQYNQWLTLYWSRVYGNIYLTTQVNADYYWQILPGTD